MIKVDTQKIVLLDETGEDAGNNRFRNQKALETIKNYEHAVSKIDTGQLNPRVLVTGSVQKDGTIENLEIHPMEHFTPSLEKVFWDTILSRK